MKLSFALYAFAYAQDSTEVEDDVCMSGGVVVPCESSDSGAGARGRSSGQSVTATWSDEERAEKRYIDLKDMAVKYWAKNGFKGKKNGFDDRKYWAYGCHCFLLGDRPMSEMGQGQPKDALDTKCRAYKECNKCVREKHGDGCIGEMVKYTWKWSRKQAALVGLNAEGTCKGDLFQCDKSLVEESFGVKDAFNTEYHAFWSAKPGKPGFDNRDPANCPSGGSAPVKHECCGGHSRKFYWINTNKQQCCPDGKSGIPTAAEDSC